MPSWISRETIAWTEKAFKAIKTNGKWDCGSLRSGKKFKSGKRPPGVPAEVGLEEYVFAIMTEMKKDSRLKFETSGAGTKYVTLAPTTTARPSLSHNVEGQAKSAATSKGLLPVRPGEPDCVFFLRTGSCPHLSYCRFNHPNQAKKLSQDQTAKQQNVNGVCGPTRPSSHVKKDQSSFSETKTAISEAIVSKKSRPIGHSVEPQLVLCLSGSQSEPPPLTYAQVSGLSEPPDGELCFNAKIIGEIHTTSERRSQISSSDQGHLESQQDNFVTCNEGLKAEERRSASNVSKKYDPIKLNVAPEEIQRSTTASGRGTLVDDLLRYFFCPSPPPLGLERGCALADRAHAVHFGEAALLGTLDRPTFGSSGGLDPTVGSMGECEVYLNTGEPFCLAAVGVQGGGKSHTMACILEACLVPFPEHGVVRLQQPMSALVLHYDHNVTSVCEATGLISPAPHLSRILAGCSLQGGAVAVTAAVPRCLPRENMVVLVSPSYWRQRKAFYGDYCIVKPLLFKWGSLTADHIKKIMRIKDGDTQLYMAAMLDLLRQYQQAALTPAFPAFVQQVRQHCNLKGQEGPLAQRLRLLESVVAEGEANAALASESADLWSCVRPGVLVVADLTDPLLASDEANGIFQVLTEQYRAMPSAAGGGGKLLALDEAHKFMSGDAADGLSEAIVNVARLMRHDGMRLAVSTQSPAALAPELLELVTVAVLHRFHSRDWFTYLAKKLPLPAAARQQLMELRPGHALVFASQHRLPAVGHLSTIGANGVLGRVREAGRSSYVDEECGHDGDSDGGQEHVFAVHVRPRITADRGATRINSVAV